MLDLLEQRFHGERRLHTECDGGSTTAVAASPMNFLRRIGVLQKIGPGIVAVYSTVEDLGLPPKDFVFAGIAQIAPLMSLLGQNRKSSMRPHVFRFAPESRHYAMRLACPKGANNGHALDIWSSFADRHPEYRAPGSRG